MKKGLLTLKYFADSATIYDVGYPHEWLWRMRDYDDMFETIGDNAYHNDNDSYIKLRYKSKTIKIRNLSKSYGRFKQTGNYISYIKYNQNQKLSKFRDEEEQRDMLDLQTIIGEAY